MLVPLSFPCGWLGGALCVLLLLGLLGLEGGVVDVPQQGALESEADDDENQDGEELGLVVEDGDGLVGGADALEPVELTHGGGLEVCVCFFFVAVCLWGRFMWPAVARRLALLFVGWSRCKIYYYDKKGICSRSEATAGKDWKQYVDEDEDGDEKIK
jgi:hypothetical protein